jgi:hypothetical protein
VLFGALGGGIWLVVTVLIIVPPATYGRRARRRGRADAAVPATSVARSGSSHAS